MAFINQSSALPTTKLTVAVLIPLAVQEIGPLVWPALATSPNTSMLIGAILAAILGYLVPDWKPAT